MKKILILVMSVLLLASCTTIKEKTVVVEMDKEMFERVVSALDGDFAFKGEKPAIVKFGAPWCGPCKMVAPILEQLSEEYEGIDIYDINVDEEGELAQVFGIQSVPTFLFIPMEGEIQMMTGALPKPVFEEKIKEVFAF